MNDIGVYFIRQEQHQKLIIAEFVLKKLKINNLRTGGFEKRRLVFYILPFSEFNFEERFPRTEALSSIVKTISTFSLQ
jgi:hypothetical protein